MPLRICIALFLSVTTAGAASLSLDPGSGIFKWTWIGGDDSSPGVYRGGMFLQLLSGGATGTELRITDARTNLLRELSIRIPEASVIQMTSVSRSAEGAFAVGGLWLSLDNKRSGFLNFFDPNGRSTVVSIKPFIPQQITFAADGTLWAVGEVRNDELATDYDPSHGILRHFGRAGQFLNSLYPQKAAGSARVWQSEMAMGADRIGWLSGSDTDRTGSYVEVMNDGSTVEYRGPPLDWLVSANLIRLALLGDDSVFASGMNRRGEIQIFRLDRGAKTWEETTFPAPPAAPGILLGSDDRRLAIMDAGADQVHFYIPSSN